MRAGFLAVTTAVLATGCDVVFAVEPPATIQDATVDAPAFSPCSAALFDDPLRYAALPRPMVEEAWSWDDARTMCRQRGMDLAVINEERELGAAFDLPGWPYWVGHALASGRWSTVDGCAALEPPPRAAITDGCGAVLGPTELGAIACSGVPAGPEPGIVQGALCETPPAREARCLDSDPAGARYVSSDAPMTYAEARQLCADMDGTIVVADSHAEWLHLAELAREQLHARFWIGSTFDGTEWQTETGCPATYSWAGGTPGIPRAGSCVAVTLAVDGVEPTACESSDVLAVCELR